jgi:hypothetical protein
LDENLAAFAMGLPAGVAQAIDAIHDDNPNPAP